MQKTRLLTTLAITAAVIASLAYRHWSTPTDLNIYNSGKFMVMGTFAQVSLRCSDEQTAQEAVAAAQAAINHVDELMSTYRDDSELARVNRLAADEPVAVSKETFDLLTRALEYSRLSDGAFDITVPPLLQLWKQAAKNDREPDQVELDAALELVGYQYVDLTERDGRTFVSFARKGMSLNVDAIAKGYAVDLALQATRLPGVTAAMVDIGGEVACFGNGRPSGGWLVGVQDPFAPDTDNQLSQSPRWVLRLRDRAVATSGNYRRYVTVAAKRMSHIVDPRTGRPAAKLPSVTVTAPTATEADALATIISVIGPEKGMQLIESRPNVELLAIAGNAAETLQHRSTGFSQHEVPR